MKKLLFTILILVMAFSVVTPFNAQAQNVSDGANDTTTSETTEAYPQETTTFPSEEETTTVPSEEETTTAPAEEETTTTPSEEITEPSKEPVTDPSDDEPSQEPTDDTKPAESIVYLNGKKIMIVGNSMLYYSNFVISGDRGKADYGYFYQLIASNNEKATVVDHTYPGKKLDYIYDNYLVKLSKAELSSYDYVILSEAKQVNNDLLGTCKKIMALFPETTKFRFMCHPMIYDENLVSIIKGLEDLRANNIEVVDWGKMVYDIYTDAVKVPGATMKFDRCSFIKDNKGYKNGTGSIDPGNGGDNKHPNPLSGYISAQMLYTSLTNRSALLADYSFCDDKSIHKYFDIDAFAKAHYTGTKKTNFNLIFRSPQDMLGLQTLIDVYLEAEGRHPLVIEEAVNPTCTSGGLTEGYYCSVCGLVVKSQEFIKSKGGHVLVYDKAVSPKCTAAGKTAGIHCSSCNKVLLAQKAVAATGHTSKETITPATVSAHGAKVTSCSVCGKTLSTVKIYKIESIALSETKYVYNGKAKKPSVTVKDSKGKTLKNGTDYTLTYSSGRKNIGDYTVTVKFKGSYSSSKKLTFKIRAGVTDKVTTKSYLKSVKLSWEKVTGATGYRVFMYDTSTKKYKKIADTSKISYKVKNLKAGQKYKFRVKAYTKVGSKTYYSSSYKSVSALTKPEKATLSSAVSKLSGQTALTWKTVSGATGYQIVYSTSSNFKSVKKVTVNKGSAKSTTVKKLTKGKKYYFKVRAYKTLNGKKVYGAYSSVKSVTVR